MQTTHRKTPVVSCRDQTQVLPYAALCVFCYDSMSKISKCLSCDSTAKGDAHLTCKCKYPSLCEHQCSTYGLHSTQKYRLAFTCDVACFSFRNSNQTVCNHIKLVRRTGLFKWQMRPPRYLYLVVWVNVHITAFSEC